MLAPPNRRRAVKGIEGRLYFPEDAESGKTKQLVLSVKASRTGVGLLHELRGVIERGGAEIGVLITMQEPTQPMRVETAGAGFYHPPDSNNNHSRLQILTVADLLAGKSIDMPAIRQGSVGPSSLQSLTLSATRRLIGQAGVYGQSRGEEVWGGVGRGPVGGDLGTCRCEMPC